MVVKSDRRRVVVDIEDTDDETCLGGERRLSAVDGVNGEGVGGVVGVESSAEGDASGERVDGKLGPVSGHGLTAEGIANIAVESFVWIAGTDLENQGMEMLALKSEKYFEFEQRLAMVR